MKQTRSKPGARRSAADDDRLEEDWPDEDWEDSEPEYGIECGLPLVAENFATGEPLVTVDYFDFAPAHKAAIADGLLTLEGAVPDDGAATQRILVFDTRGGPGPHDPLPLIAIATVQDEALRVETAHRALADRVRDAVQAALGARVRYRARTKENPVEVFLNAE
jgi:hypothetical protein